MFVKALALSGAIAASAAAQITSFDLGNYRLSGTFDLPPIAASEASAISFNWDTGNLLVLGDEGDALAEVNRMGQVVSTMTLTGFDDTEGLTYLGNGQYALAEERLERVYRFNYAAGGTLDRSSLQNAALGPVVGNIGIEGISYEPRTGRFIAVKEKDPQRVLTAQVDFGAGTANVDDLFVPNLGLLDLSDVQVLSVVPGLIGTTDQDNLIILSQESQRMLEVSRTGQVLSQFDFSALSANAEGITIAPDGTIFVCDESPRMFVLTPVPAPSGAALLGIGGLVAARRRRR